MSNKNTRKKASSRSRVSKNNNNNTRTGSKQFESSLLKDIGIILVFAACIFFFICLFGLGGLVGSYISMLFFGLFGLLAYVLPCALFIGILVLISNQANKVSVIKFISGFVFISALAAFVWAVIPDFSPDYEITTYFNMSAETKSYGGLIGGILAKLFFNVTGKFGAFVIIILLVVISIILISERSFLRRFERRERQDNSIEKENIQVLKPINRDRDVRRERKRLELQEKRIREREEWEEEKLRRQEELERKKASLAQMKGNVTTDTKLVPPEKLPKKEENIQTKSEIVKNVTSLEDTIASQQVTEIHMPDEEIEESIYADSYVPFEENTLNHTTNILYEYNDEVDDVVDATTDEVAEAADVDAAVADTTEATVVEKLEEELLVKDSGKLNNRGFSPDKYKFPPISLLEKGDGKTSGDSVDHIRDMENKLVSTLRNFGVNVKILNTSCGPTVTRFELQPEQGVKVSKILSLTDDIKLNLAASDIRIEAPIPGKAAIGIEVPNKSKASVRLKDLVASKEFKDSQSKLTMTVGKDIGGNVIVSDIAKMPHLLIAGATGSGKSVCINTIIMSVLYKARPDEVKLIMVDPKVVELGIYNGIPHLLIPVVTDPKKASGALNWAVGEMTNRYQSFANMGVRDIKGYNKKIEELKESNDSSYNQDLHTVLPQILIIVDELADLMMVAPREVEDSICRLAQLARAAGIHLIIATQRPSVDVVTGLIKANMPSRLALSVSSGVDSRTIIDMNGAEKLLGNGDMLFYPQGFQKPQRIQGAFVSDSEVEKVVQFLKNQKIENLFSNDIEKQINSAVSTGQGSVGNGEPNNGRDELFEQAARLIVECDKASIGNLQRRLRIGFNRAARIMDQLCDAGIVGVEEGTKPREILMSMEQLEQFFEESL